MPFLLNRDFAHAHAGRDHSLHLTLPPEPARRAQDLGWAEPHLLVASGAVPATVVLINASRDEEESDLVSTLLHASYRYATTKP